MKKEILTILFSLILCLGLCCTTALAADAISYVEYSWDGTDRSSATKSITEYTVVTPETTTWSDDGWYVVTGEVTIDSLVTVSNSANIILTDGCSLTVNGGICVIKGETLRIYAQSIGTGKLTANGSDKNAGIGGIDASDKRDCGTIEIHGGVIIANGGAHSAGIGGNGTGDHYAGNGGLLAIYNGTITATGGNGESGNLPRYGGAGIGGGSKRRGAYGAAGNGGTVNIYGGVVTATGKFGGTGIGGGGGDIGGKSGTVSVYGGIVTAVGGKTYDYAGYDFGCGAGAYNERVLPKQSNCMVNGTVSGNFTMSENYTVPSDKTITVPTESSLTIPRDVTLTVNGTLKCDGNITNNGTLILQSKDKLSGNGTVTGNGTNRLINFSPNYIRVPNTLTYNGKDQTTDAKSNISIPEKITSIICGADFICDTSGWTYSISPEIVKDAATYTVVYKKDNNTATKTFTVAHKNITGADATITFEEMTYTGSSQTPTIIVIIDGLYVTGSCNDVTNVSDEITFTADGNFTGSIKGLLPGMKPKPITAAVTTSDIYWDDTLTSPVSVVVQTGIPNQAITISGVTATFADNDIGTNKIASLNKESMSITCSPTDKLENYEVIIPETAKINVNIIPLDISGVKMGAQSYTYGDAVTYDNTAVSITQPGGTDATADNLIYTYTGTANNGTHWNSTTAPTLSGSYTLTINHKDTEHYIGSQVISFTIQKAPLVIAAVNQKCYILTKVPDISTPELNKHYTVEGLLGEDSIGTITMKYRKDGEDVTPDNNETGIYDIAFSITDANPNYDISYVNGTLTLENYPPSVVVTSKYDVKIADGITGGTVSANTNLARQDNTITITIAPDANNELTALTVINSRGKSITLKKLSDTEYSFKMPGYDVEIDAEFTKTEISMPVVPAVDCDHDSTCPMYPFIDLDLAAWYHNGTHYCIEHGLMGSTNTDRSTFEPSTTTTRAMIVTILWRIEGNPVVNYLLNFEDVDTEQWYSEAIRWATSEKIVEGYGNGKFGTNDAITREQMTTILFRYAKYKGYDISVGENTNILSFNDVSNVADWAIPAMQWGCGSGVIQGIANDNNMNLEPQGDATRAQSATIFYRFIDSIANKNH